MHLAQSALLAGTLVAAATVVALRLHDPRSSRAAPRALAERGSDEGPAPRPPVDPATTDRLLRLGALLALARPAWGAGEPLPPEVAQPDYPVMPVVVAGHDRVRVDPAYLQTRVRDEITPLVLLCYRAAVERDPTAGGRLILRYRILGNRRVGGVVDEAWLASGTTLTDPELRTCATESMMSITFDAPPGDSAVNGSYAMDLGPELLADEG